LADHREEDRGGGKKENRTTFQKCFSIRKARKKDKLKKNNKTRRSKRKEKIGRKSRKNSKTRPGQREGPAMAPKKEGGYGQLPYGPQASTW